MVKDIGGLLQLVYVSCMLQGMKMLKYSQVFSDV